MLFTSKFKCSVIQKFLIFPNVFLGVIILIPVLQVDQLYRMIDCITQILVQKFKVEQVTKFFSNKCYNYLDAMCV